MAEYFPNLMRTIYLQIQEDHQISGSTKRKHNKHIIVKLLKTTDKKNIFKAAIEGREERHNTSRETKDYNKFVRNNATQEAVRTVIKNTEKKNQSDTS